MRALLRDASACGSAGEAERLASDVVAYLGDREFGVQLDIGVRDVVDAIERAATPDALALLQALAYVDAAGALGECARAASDRLVERGAKGPGWLPLVGHARPTGAWIVRDHDFDDASILFVDFGREHGPHPLLAVFVDHNLGGAAKHVNLCTSMDDVVAVSAAMPGDDMEPEPIALDDAASRLRSALAATPPEVRGSIVPGMTNLFALAEARLGSLPAAPPRPGPSEIGPDERFMLLEGFLQSNEGQAFRDDLDAQTAVARAIDFCADYIDGRPLRWSPTLVEIFVVDWLPEYTGDDPRILERMPEALRAWIRFAGQQRGMAAELVDETLAELDQWSEEIRAMAYDGGAAISSPGPRRRSSSSPIRNAARPSSTRQRSSIPGCA